MLVLVTQSVRTYKQQQVRGREGECDGIDGDVDGKGDL
jgi:hypothetical protein